ncbi:hypothetical protein V565_350430, partial [Rhizoctonia solani 123E]
QPLPLSYITPPEWYPPTLYPLIGSPPSPTHIPPSMAPPPSYVPPLSYHPPSLSLHIPPDDRPPLTASPLMESPLGRVPLLVVHFFCMLGQDGRPSMLFLHA